MLLTGEASPAHECLALDKGAIDVIRRSRGPEVLVRRLKSAAKASNRTDQPRSGGPMVCGKLILRPDVSRAYLPIPVKPPRHSDLMAPGVPTGCRPGRGASLAEDLPWQEPSDVVAALVGCGHMSGLLMRHVDRWP